MILNLTQHPATTEQINAGVVDLPPHLRGQLTTLLTFDTLPTKEQIEIAAAQIATLAHGQCPEKFRPQAMIGGAPWLMAPLEAALAEGQGILPIYAFSRRESVEQFQPDGSVKKINIFKHAGFVPAVMYADASEALEGYASAYMVMSTEKAEIRKLGLSEAESAKKMEGFITCLNVLYNATK